MTHLQSRNIISTLVISRTLCSSPFSCTHTICTQIQETSIAYNGVHQNMNIIYFSTLKQLIYKYKLRVLLNHISFLISQINWYKTRLSENSTKIEFKGLQLQLLTQILKNTLFKVQCSYLTWLMNFWPKYGKKKKNYL